MVSLFNWKPQCHWIFGKWLKYVLKVSLPYAFARSFKARGLDNLPAYTVKKGARFLQSLRSTLLPSKFLTSLCMCEAWHKRIVLSRSQRLLETWRDICILFFTVYTDNYGPSGKSIGLEMSAFRNISWICSL